VTAQERVCAFEKSRKPTLDVLLVLGQVDLNSSGVGSAALVIPRSLRNADLQSHVARTIPCRSVSVSACFRPSWAKSDALHPVRNHRVMRSLHTQSAHTRLLAPPNERLDVFTPIPDQAASSPGLRTSTR
jgi:hypothetical protein